MRKIKMKNTINYNKWAGELILFCLSHAERVWNFNIFGWVPYGATNKRTIKYNEKKIRALLTSTFLMGYFSIFEKSSSYTKKKNKKNTITTALFRKICSNTFFYSLSSQILNRKKCKKNMDIYNFQNDEHKIHLSDEKS